jgi:phosphohistidine swiveling domain-containing protein
MNKRAKEKIKLVKSYTRDSSLIIQEMWLKALSQGLVGFSDVASSSVLVGLDYLHDGVIEVWENEKAIGQIKKNLVAMCKKDPQKIKDFFKRYGEGVKKLQAWKLISWSEFTNYVKAVEYYVVSDLVASYLAEQDFPAWARTIASRLREKDTYFVDNNEKIIKGLLRFKPVLGKYAVCITKDELLGKIPVLSELKKRWEGFVVTSNSGCCLGNLENFVKRASNKIVLDRPKIGTGRNCLKGKVANGGKVVSRVKIMKLVGDIKKVKRGDIVVAPMTNIDFLPALKLAAAIVTDEGGIICHASIIARELNIPCIVGVKIATEVLCDGDLVEVDAYKGIIKKYENHISQNPNY